MRIYEDPFDARLVQGAAGLLREFNAIGLLLAADVHVADRLCALAGEADEAVALAVAMAVRAPRLGHVYVDLAEIAGTAAVDTEDEVDLTALPWPEPAAWVAAVAASPLTAVGEDAAAGDERPLRLVGSALYL
ncbi:MAG: exodeoxyribonuclease alpha subunit, partial [Solirubrobacteraceae bacterium]|nr:exodeoxyribonuclease alpha subunit [Solirubrobacteraceae bacterium]